MTNPIQFKIWVRILPKNSTTHHEGYAEPRILCEFIDTCSKKPKQLAMIELKDSQSDSRIRLYIRGEDVLTIEGYDVGNNPITIAKEKRESDIERLVKCLKKDIDC